MTMIARNRTEPGASRNPSPRSRRPALVACLLALAAAFALACGSGKALKPVPPSLGAVSTIAGITTLPQRVPAADSGGSVVIPGQANAWDLGRNMALRSGGDGQFSRALALSVRVAASTSAFPSSQTYAGLTWYTPNFNAANGATAVVYSSGSARLAGSHFSQLYQTVDLRNTNGVVTLSFDVANDPFSSEFSDETQFFQFVIRDASRATLMGGPIYLHDNDPLTTDQLSTVDVDISAIAGQVVRLDFEQRRVADGGATINGVSIMDDDREFVMNGSFNSGLTAWGIAALTEPQNVTSTTQTLEGLDVTRSFFTAPGSLWGRWVDVFTNNTGGSISATMIYATTLGAGQCAVIYETAGPSGRVVTAWDGDPIGTSRIRDVGLAMGNPDRVTFASNGADMLLADCDGTDDIGHEYDLTLAPGETAVLVNYLVMNGVKTGESAGADHTALATQIDQELARISAGYPTTNVLNEFTNGMTQAQIDDVVNF